MDVNTLADYCIGSKGAPSDIAQVANVVLKNKFRYIGNNVWEYQDDESNEWRVDTNNVGLFAAIRLNVCQIFIDRSIYWQNQTYTADISMKIDCQLRCQKMLEICIKLKKEKYIKDVAKEARAFLSVIG